eukprot:scaffold203989_cov28-Prasinocladus_malaysianus.AAC.1
MTIQGRDAATLTATNILNWTACQQNSCAAAVHRKITSPSVHVAAVPICQQFDAWALQLGNLVRLGSREKS